MGAQIALVCAETTSMGMRTANEDAMGRAEQDALSCFVLSDGAGGHEAGEVAAAIVVECVMRTFVKDAAFAPRAMKAYIDMAVAAVSASKRDAAHPSDMSATVATLLIDRSNARALWAHLGDTRIYWFRDDKIVRITKDHSMAQQFIDAGYAKRDELRIHPQRNILFAAIGGESETPPEITQEVVTIKAGDVFLMCTDGFWEWVLEADMERTLALANTSEEWLAAMSRIADGNVGATRKIRDNYSVYAIWVQAPGADA